eukprot:scaffold38191_cov20-Tisochrysis_lutea.AAC.1
MDGTPVPAAAQPPLLPVWLPFPKPLPSSPLSRAGSHPPPGRGQEGTIKPDEENTKIEVQISERDELAHIAGHALS